MERDSVEQLVLTAKFVGANPNPDVVAKGEMEYKCNYFLGNEPSEWSTDVPNYEAITLKDIYPGIDLKYSGDGNGQAAYEFVIAPGADVAQIKVEYEGAEETSLDSDGRLVVRTKWGDMIAAIKSPAHGVLFGPGSFSQLSEKTIGSEAAGASRQAQGTFGVTLSNSTYLGGSNRERAYRVAVDGSGCAYVTGYTVSSNFPLQNPFQGSIAGGYTDAFVTKLSADGNSLIYSTYLGGDGSDYATSLAVDGSGCAYVTGYTESSDFPLQSPFQRSHAGVTDAFVTKLSADGNFLIFSTYLGGGSTDAPFGLAIDDSDCAYMTGYTESSDFPLQNPFQGSNAGSTDIFVTKLSADGNSLVYSTYLGGGADDGTYLGFIENSGIAVDGSGCAYVTGTTFSSNFPLKNPFQGSKAGYYDAFVTKLSTDGNSLIYSTYLGGSYDDIANGLAVDTSGFVYVMGLTGSINFPLQSPFQESFAGAADAFVTKLSPDGNFLVYSTYLGGDSYDWAYGLAVDGSGNAYVTGETESSDFPLQNPFQGSFAGGYGDAFVTKLSWTPDYHCGDVNTDEQIDLRDAVFLINYIFVSGPAPQSLSLADVNCSGSINIADVVRLINYIFAGGPAPCAACK
jgi:hypothetical protein